MALFGRNKTPAAKHSIIEVIEYNGPNDILIWKFPNEDFNTNTQLIVGPSQEAIFIKGGQVLGRFTSGTHTLNTKNYPFIRALVGLVTGGVSPFQCSVYYVNKVVSMGIDWGTDMPISIVDPVYGVPADVTSYGDFSIRVQNGQMLMEKLVGQTQGFSQQEIQEYFSGLMASQVRSIISGTILGNGLSLIGIDQHLPSMSEMAREKLQPVFEPYGMEVVHFAIAAINSPHLEAIKDKQRTIVVKRMDIDIAAEEKRKMAQAQAFENRELGFSAKEQAVADIGRKLAENPGPVMGAAGGMGFPGMIGGNIIQPSAAGTVEIARMLSGHGDPAPQPFPDSDTAMPGGGMPGFGMMEEASPQPAEPPAGKGSFKERAENLKQLHDLGMISEEEYQASVEILKNEILGRN